MIKKILILSLLGIAIIKSAALPQPHIDPRALEVLDKIQEISNDLAKQVQEIDKKRKEEQKIELEKLLSESRYNALLSLAASYGNIDFVQLAIDNKADINSSDMYYMPAIHIAAGVDLEIVKLLLKHNADKDTKCKTLSTPLMQAAAAGKYSIVKFLLDIKADKNCKDADGANALNFASAYSGDIETVRILLDSGLDVNSRTNQDPNIFLTTPLKNANLRNRKLIPILLKYGATVENMYLHHKPNLASDFTLLNDDNFFKNTISNNLQFLENRKNSYAWHALQKIRGKAISYYKINSIDNIGMTALMWAASRGNEKIVEILLDYGRKTGLVNVVYENNEYETALVLAQQRGHKKIAKDIYDYLLQHRINLAKLFRPKKLPLRVGLYLAEFIYGGR